jgi:anti-sigma regulatory factor (Ser/Thr protein kinase)
MPKGVRFPIDVEARLPVTPASAAAARHALDDLLHDVELETLQHVQLLVSELITNSYRHAGLADADAIEMKVLAGERCIRVEVRDRGRGFTSGEPRPDPDNGRGWGLFLVDAIAQRWGVVRGAGTLVWFEVDRPRDEAGGRAVRSARSR